MYLETTEDYTELCQLNTTLKRFVFVSFPTNRELRYKNEIIFEADVNHFKNPMWKISNDKRKILDYLIY